MYAAVCRLLLRHHHHRGRHRPASRRAPFRPPQMHSRVLPTPSHSAAFTLGNNCARCALFRHPPFPLDLWATRWLHPSTKPYTPPADTVKHPTTSNFDPPVLAVPPIARHSTAAVVSLATARFAVSYRRGGSNLMGDIYSTEGSDFWGLRGPKCVISAFSFAFGHFSG
jgi:hypothetical protein